MNAESFAEWLRRQGHHVLRTRSSYWYDQGPRVYQAFPYHWLIQPPEDELRSLITDNLAVAVRYSAPVSSPEGMLSYHVLVRRPYNLEMLRAQARNGVRRGLNNFQVEPLTFSRLADEGWALQQDTLVRQGRTRSMSQTEWQSLCLAAEELAGFEAWGATSQGELAASLLVVRVDDTYCIPYALSHSRFLRDHVNNALFYTVVSDLLSREGVSQVFFCVQSLDAPESVDEFKFRMSFSARPVRQRVVFHPLLAPLANRYSHGLIARLLRRDPSSPFLAKAEGVLRFYLTGKAPLTVQSCPECLAKEKLTLVGSPYSGNPQTE